MEYGSNRNSKSSYVDERAPTAVMRGQKPDRHPIVTRLENWYKSHLGSGTLPERFAGMSLNQVHRAVGVGQLKFMVPYALRLRGVEVSSVYEGDEFYREFEPVFENFPGHVGYHLEPEAGRHTHRSEDAGGDLCAFSTRSCRRAFSPPRSLI